MAKKTAAKTKAPAKAPEPAVMAAGASEENAEEGKGMPPADAPDVEDQPADGIKAGEGSVAAAVSASGPDGGESVEGFRNDKGQFTGNAPTDSERIDAIVKVLKANGLSMPKELE